MIFTKYEFCGTSSMNIKMVWLGWILGRVDGFILNVLYIKTIGFNAAMFILSWKSLVAWGNCVQLTGWIFSKTHIKRHGWHPSVDETQKFIRCYRDMMNMSWNNLKVVIYRTLSADPNHQVFRILRSLCNIIRHIYNLLNAAT